MEDLVNCEFSVPMACSVSEVCTKMRRKIKREFGFEFECKCKNDVFPIKGIENVGGSVYIRDRLRQASRNQVEQAYCAMGPFQSKIPPLPSLSLSPSAIPNTLDCDFAFELLFFRFSVDGVIENLGDVDGDWPRAEGV